jgi:hypothetical protein
MRHVLFFIFCLASFNVLAGHPEGRAAVMVDAAQSNVYVTASALTPDWPLYDALIRAQASGVNVRVMVHRHRYNGASELRTAGIAVYEIEDSRLGARSLDDFFIVIDGAVMVRGTQVSRDEAQAYKIVQQFKDIVLSERRLNWAERR